MGDATAPRRLLLVLAAALAGGCAGLAQPPVRPEPVAYLDTLPIEEPAGRSPAEVSLRWERAFTEELGAVTEPRRWFGVGREALNVTRFDGVVSSAWFEHRNGRERMSPREVREGAATAPGPDTSRTITVVSGKVSGAMPGFTVEDARGDRYLVKFDPPDWPGLATNPDVITSRLFHAAGYHVPANYLVTLDPDDLVVAEDAEFDYGGSTRPMTRADLRTIVDSVARLPDGRVRGIASRFIPGEPKGPFFFEGRRADDPNDHYLHQHRRELRGIWVLAAWLNHSDLIFQNTLDVWIDPPGYLKHYVLDFSASLGSSQVAAHNPREMYEYELDLWASLARYVTLGLYEKGWEERSWETIHPSLGALPAENFDPGAWTPNWPTWAWREMTPADAYWGAKLVASFTDRQIRAAIASGSLEPPQADTLADILAVRRDRVVEHWYGKVTPVEEPSVEAGGEDGTLRLTFRDLGLEDGPWTAEGTTYRWRFRHEALEREAGGTAQASAGARQALDVPLGPSAGIDPGELSDDEQLARLELTARRGSAAGRPAVVFLRWEGPAEGYRAVALRH